MAEEPAENAVFAEAIKAAAPAALEPAADGSELRQRGGGGGGVREVTSMDEWVALLSRSSAGPDRVVVKFTAKWCKPCKKIAPLFKELSADGPGLFAEVDVDVVDNLMDDAGVSALPCIQAYSGATKYGEVYPGEDEAALREFVDKHRAAS